MSTSDLGSDCLIRTAIRADQTDPAPLSNKLLIVEPYDYGIHNDIKLLTWSIGGTSSTLVPKRRWMGTDLISDAQSGSFRMAAPTPSGEHHKWDNLCLRVYPADQDLENTQPTAQLTRPAEAPRCSLKGFSGPEH